MEVSDVAKMRGLEDENRRLKKLLADSALEIDAPKLIAWDTSDAHAAATSCAGGNELDRAEPTKACDVTQQLAHNVVLASPS